MENLNNPPTKKTEKLDEATKIRTEERGTKHIKWEKTLQSLLTNLDTPSHIRHWELRRSFLDVYKNNKNSIDLIKKELADIKDKESLQYELKQEELEDMNMYNYLIATYLLESMEGLYDKESIFFRDEMYNLGVAGDKLRQNTENAPTENNLLKEYRTKWLLGETNQEAAERAMKQLEKREKEINEEEHNPEDN